MNVSFTINSPDGEPSRARQIVTQTQIKNIQLTASKQRKQSLDVSKDSRIRNQIFACFRHQKLKGKIKVQNFDTLDIIQMVFYHRIQEILNVGLWQNVQQNVRIIFGEQYPSKAPQISIHSCSILQSYPDYNIPDFGKFQPKIVKWMCNYQLGNILADLYGTIDDYHHRQLQKLTKIKNQEHQILQQEQQQQRQTIKRQRRKSSTMTGCADKQLTETKNLNRHFRSKLRQVLRDLMEKETNEEARTVQSIFIPNRVGFQDIRRALSNQWFNRGVQKQINSGQFLHKILRGMMGIKSKKLMIKYYHVMVSAVQSPQNFVRWKYD